MRIVVIGSGYVGLVTGVCFAEKGHRVTCIDLDEEKVTMLQNGKVPFYEDGLESLLQKNLKSKKIHFTSSYKEAYKDADISFIAVPTPPLDDGCCNIGYVLAASEMLAPFINENHLVITKSTVPVGTAKKVQKRIKQHTEVSFHVASNPEFLKEGSAVDDCLFPDRVIIGTNTTYALDALRELYAPFNLKKEQFLEQNIESAEITKYASNAMLATRISFMNELSRLCEKVGADIEMVREGMGKDVRIGPGFLKAGIGYGGSCFPKDINALIATGKNHQIELSILQSVENANKKQRELFLQKIQNRFTSLKGKKFGIWGLSFKPGTDDIRSAPALDMIRYLLENGASITLFDPHAMDAGKKLFQDERIQFSKTPYLAAENVDALILATEWPCFKEVDLTLVLEKMNGNSFFDGRNVYCPKLMNELGYNYYSIGRPLTPDTSVKTHAEKSIIN